MCCSYRQGNAPVTEQARSRGIKVRMKRSGSTTKPPAPNWPETNPAEKVIPTTMLKNKLLGLMLAAPTVAITFAGAECFYRSPVITRRWSGLD